MAITSRGNAHSGVTPIDWAAAFVIFLTFIGVSFYYIGYVATPTKPFEELARQQSQDIAAKLKQNLTWTVYRTPVFIDSSQNVSQGWPFEVPFSPPSNYDANSLTVTDSAGRELASQFDSASAKLIWVAPLIATKDINYAIYTLGTNLSPSTLGTDIGVSGLTVTNSKLNTRLSSFGFSSVNFSGRELLASNGLNLTGLVTPTITSGKARALANWTTPTTINAKLYSNGSRIVFSAATPINATLSFSSSFTNFYNGTENNFSGQTYNATLNFLDLYDGVIGVGIIGANMSTALFDNSVERAVIVKNTTSFEIFAHIGNYTNALAERDAFLSQPKTIAGTLQNLTGISEDAINAMAAGNYDALKTTLGITGFDFYVTVEK